MKNTFTEAAIRDAIKGGWKVWFHGQYLYEFKNKYIIVNMMDGAGRIEFYHYEIALLDPDFWKALGKARGWIDKDYPNGEMRCDITVKGERRCEDRYCGYAGFIDPVSKWHSLIDHLAKGKDIESYFESLQA